MIATQSLAAKLRPVCKKLIPSIKLLRTIIIYILAIFTCWEIYIP